MSEPTRVPAEALARFAAGLLERLGLPGEDAALAADALVQADLDGVETHGLGRLPNYVARLRKGLVSPTPQMRLISQFGATALLDADNGMGQIAAARAMREAVRLAETNGIGLVAVRHSNHFGAASYYCDIAVAAGMIGVALSNTPPGMAPYGGREAFLGTNPIGIGIPAGEEPPISVDMATSAAARGQVLKARREGAPIPPGWAIGPDGAPTTDAEAALQGALLPMAGAKGFGLALAVEALCGALAGAAIGREIPSFFDNWEQPSNVGHTLLALNIAAFGPPEAFERRMAGLIHDLRQVPPAQGHESVRAPGERRARSAAERRASGVPLAPATATALRQLAEELGAPPLTA